MPLICEGFIHHGAMQRERKKRYWGLFGYGVFFYVWERVIGGFEGVSFGIENSGYFSSFFVGVVGVFKATGWWLDWLS